VAAPHGCGQPAAPDRTPHLDLDAAPAPGDHREAATRSKSTARRIRANPLKGAIFGIKNLRVHISRNVFMVKLAMTNLRTRNETTPEPEVHTKDKLARAMVVMVAQ
jgi:hypothetical protein